MTVKDTEVTLKKVTLMKFTLKLTLLSDTCWSSGLSRRNGDVDLEVELDADTGLPVLRGRTLKGLLMEELALILRAVEPKESGIWHSAAERLLGTSGAIKGGQLRFGEGSLSPAVTQWVEEVVQRNGSGSGAEDHPGVVHPGEIRDGLTVIRRQTRIDAQTGTAELDTLRSTRLLREGLEFFAPVQSLRPLDDHVKALLAAATLGLRRVGVHRNRGWGQVVATLLDEHGTDVTLTWFQPLQSAMSGGPDSASPQAGPGSAAATITLAEQSTGMGMITQGQPPSWRVSYQVRLLSPALFANGGGDPNTASTLPYVPGSTILGAMAWRYLEKERTQNPVSDPSSTSTFRQLFTLGDVQWLNLYPMDASGTQRFCPLPASLTQPKPTRSKRGTRIRYFDQANESFSEWSLEAEAQELDLRAAQGGFVWFSRVAADEPAERLETHKSQTSLRTHHQRDRDGGRPIVGNIYSYESLDAGQLFAGHVLCQSESQAKEVKRLLEEGALSLGRSRTATYGAEAELLNPEVHSLEADWCEVPVRVMEEAPERLVITLLSDYLGINAQGLPDPEALVPELLEVLGIPGLPADHVRTVHSERFVRLRQVPGYVSVWRMPRPSWPGIAAGSVVVLDLRALRLDLDEVTGRINMLHRTGIGERRAEGFGRVAVGWHGDQLEYQGGKSNPRGKPGAAYSAPSVPDGALTHLQSEVLAARARRQLFRLALDHAASTGGLPAPALISRLVEQVASSPEIGPVLGLMQALRFRGGTGQDHARTKKARRGLERVRVVNRSLPEWLEHLSEPKAFVKALNLEDLAQSLRLPETALEDETVKRLRQYYLDVYLGQVRRRAQEQRRKESSHA